MPADDRPSDDGLALLVVCRANKYRSVLAEHLLRERLGGLPVPTTVASAGTSAGTGRPADPAVRDLLAERGTTIPDTWRRHRLGVAAVASADVILTSDRARSSDVVALFPAAARSVFTVRAFARLLRAVDSPDPTDGTAAQRLLHAVTAARARVQPAPPAELDVADPAQRPRTMLRPCLELLEVEIASIVDGIARACAPA